MKCTVCRKKINDSAAFCRYCGAPLTPSMGGAMAEDIPYFCNMCGRELAPGERCSCMSYTPVTPDSPAFNPAGVTLAYEPSPMADSFTEEATASMAAPADVPSTKFCLYCGKVLHPGEACSCSESLAALSAEEDDTEYGSTEYAERTEHTVNVDIPPVYTGMEAPPSGEELKINVKSTYGKAVSSEEERRNAEGRAFFRPAGDL